MEKTRDEKDTHYENRKSQQHNTLGCIRKNGETQTEVNMITKWKYNN